MQRTIRTNPRERTNACLDLSTLIPPPPAVYWFPFLLASCFFLPSFLPSHVFSMRPHELHSWFCSMDYTVIHGEKERRVVGYSKYTCAPNTFTKYLKGSCGTGLDFYLGFLKIKKCLFSLFRVLCHTMEPRSRQTVFSCDHGDLNPLALLHPRVKFTGHPPECSSQP